MTIQIKDPFITTLFKTNFYSDTSKFIEAIKELFQTKVKLEEQEYNLLKAYDRGELSLGQVATILNLSKVDTMELLQKYDIPFVRVDSEYLEQEFGAFK
jgi:predicted HTH domain antitoxin